MFSPTMKTRKDSDLKSGNPQNGHRKRDNGSELFNRFSTQARLTVGQPNDMYEQEADRVADQVMNMPDSQMAAPFFQRQVPEEEEVRSKPLISTITPLVQKQIEEEEELQPRLIQRMIGEAEEGQIQGKWIQKMIADAEPWKYQQEADRVADRAMAGPDSKIQCQPEEEEVAQAKGDGAASAASFVESGIKSIRGGGRPLPASTRAFFEPRFGTSFNDVRVHAGSTATHLARSFNAKAFTVGRDVVFGSGQYSPGTSSGKKLLAHELTHSVQQNYRRSRIQRKIIVAGNTFTPTARYYTWLDNHSYSPMKEFIKRMHNGGNPPDYNFSSYTQMGREVRLRNQALKGMEEVNSNGSVNYGSPHKLDTAYWDKVGPTHFTVKSPLPASKKPSDAIESIFKAGADNRLECNSLMVAVQYRAMMTGLGKAKFNAKFPNGTGILISPHHDPRTGSTKHPIWDKKLYKQITISGEGDLLPGDWVYFKNYGDYITWNPGGLWTGEHALYMGGGKYQGFGPATFAGGTSMTKVALEQRLCDKYNIGADVAHQKTYTASTNVYPYSDSIVGLRDYARRPVIKEIDK